jgi:hypothetical protein
VQEDIAPECHAVVFTLDAYLQMARGPQSKVLEQASALADEDGNIALEDRKAVIVCPINDLESILAQATEDSLLRTLSASNEDKYQGWMLSAVHRDTGAAKEFGEPKPYPFDLDSVLPWWNRLDEFTDTDDPT